jgi:mannose-6-phosphate isomerase-like protein (cupin superfamily)
MPAVGKKIQGADGDHAEFVATSESSGGAHVKIRATTHPGGGPVEPHMHLVQTETFEVVSGRFAYRVAGREGTAGPGETITLPASVPHQHWNASPTEELVVIQTLAPGLDSDYFFETAYGIARDGKATYPGLTFQGAVWLRGLKGKFTVARLPVWLQETTAVFLAPLAQLMGYRAVYRRYSDKEW